MFKNCFTLAISLGITVCFTLISTINVHAIEVTDLYQAKVEVNSQSSADKNRALKKAMQLVLLKVGGLPEVLDNTVIKTALDKYNSYISQYSYQRDNYLDNNTLGRNLTKKIQQLSLLTSFDENKINQLFIDANLPIWGRLRPQILLWMVEEEQLSRQLLSESSLSPYPNLIDVYSNERGLPIIMPLMDLVDSEQINIADVWGRFSSPIMLASERYASEAIAIVRISNSSLLSLAEGQADCRPLCGDKEYALDWTLLLNNQHFSHQYQGEKPELLLQETVSDITKIIYDFYALSTNSENEFVIDVANIDSIASYVTLFQFLEQLSSVKSVMLISANGNNRRFKLNLLGSKHALLSSLKLNKQLQRYIDPLADVIIDSTPVFYWGQP